MALTQAGGGGMASPLMVWARREGLEKRLSRWVFLLFFFSNIPVIHNLVGFFRFWWVRRVYLYRVDHTSVVSTKEKSLWMDERTKHGMVLVCQRKPDMFRCCPFGARAENDSCRPSRGAPACIVACAALQVVCRGAALKLVPS